jgi:hypothetical protein
LPVAVIKAAKPSTVPPARSAIAYAASLPEIIKRA